MDQKLKDWITGIHEQLSGEERRELLLLLKHQPDIAIKRIAENLEDWAAIAIVKREVKGPIIIHFEEHSKELMRHFKRHFATELEAIH